MRRRSSAALPRDGFHNGCDFSLNRSRLTLYPGRKGLPACGSDAALIDYEAVDAQGRRGPTDRARVDFDITGPAIRRGGLNSAIDPAG